MSFDLNDDNFLLYAAKSYESPHLIQSEFDEDLRRIQYIKRLLRKYRTEGICQYRLILNHIIILSNVFGVIPSVNMLFLKIDAEDYSVLKTFLVYLNYLPENLQFTYNKYAINQKDIMLDLDLADKLRNI